MANELYPWHRSLFDIEPNSSFVIRLPIGTKERRHSVYILSSNIVSTKYLRDGGEETKNYEFENVEYIYTNKDHIVIKQSTVGLNNFYITNANQLLQNTELEIQHVRKIRKKAKKPCKNEKIALKKSKASEVPPFGNMRSSGASRRNSFDLEETWGNSCVSDDEADEMRSNYIATCYNSHLSQIVALFSSGKTLSILKTYKTSRRHMIDTLNMNIIFKYEEAVSTDITDTIQSLLSNHHINHTIQTTPKDTVSSLIYHRGIHQIQMSVYRRKEHSIYDPNSQVILYHYTLLLCVKNGELMDYKYYDERRESEYKLFVYSMVKRERCYHMSIDERGWYTLVSVVSGSRFVTLSEKRIVVGLDYGPDWRAWEERKKNGGGSFLYSFDERDGKLHIVSNRVKTQIRDYRCLLTTYAYIM